MQHTEIYFIYIENLHNFNIISAWYNIVCCMHRNDLLMINNYMFETCRR